MMKAEATAENRPACNPSQFGRVQAIRKTHEYQGRVQILVVSLNEIIVILLGLLPVIFVESKAIVLRSRTHPLLLAVGEALVRSRRLEAGPYHARGLPFSTVTSSFSSLQGSLLQSGFSRTGCWWWDLKPYLECPSPGLLESLGFQRFLDLRSELSIGQSVVY